MNKYYIDYLKGAGRSDNTIKSYVNNVSLMLKEINKPETEITFLDLVSWQSKLQGKSTSTIHSKVVAVQNYFDFLKNANIISSNPANGLVTAKVVNAKKPDPENGMINSLINCADNKRDKAMLTLFATTGMRFEEATTITIEQYRQRRFNIVGKGNKMREIYINDQTKKVCDEYLESRKDNFPLLFVTNRGNQVDNSNWCKWIKICAKKANLDCWDKITPHWLRHAFATTASQMGVPVADIGFALGHSDYAKVTSRYIHTPQNKVVNIMANIQI